MFCNVFQMDNYYNEGRHFELVLIANIMFVINHC